MVAIRWSSILPGQRLKMVGWSEDRGWWVIRRGMVTVRTVTMCDGPHPVACH